VFSIFFPPVAGLNTGQRKRAIPPEFAKLSVESWAIVGEASSKMGGVLIR
jgi:hypothetical protein